MFSLLFTPLGRYAIVAVIAMMALGGIYMKIRHDAVAEIELKASMDALRRTQNAIRAGNAVDVSPDRVREPDSNRRD